MHQKYDENLESPLKDYNVNPFEDRSVTWISTGQDISSRSTPSFRSS